MINKLKKDIISNKKSVNTNSSKSGIYFLLKGEEVVYVGKATNFIDRLIAHIDDKDFDSYSVVECSKDEIDELETEYIYEYMPIYNKTINSGDMLVSAKKLNLGSEYLENQEIKGKIINGVAYFKIDDLKLNGKKELFLKKISHVKRGYGTSQRIKKVDLDLISYLKDKDNYVDEETNEKFIVFDRFMKERVATHFGVKENVIKYRVNKLVNNGLLIRSGYKYKISDKWNTEQV